MTNILVRILGLGTMTMAMAALLQPLGCASASSTAEPLTLHNNWIYVTSSGSGGAALNVKPDNTYVQAKLGITSNSNAVQAQVETGTISVSGSTITFTPQEWSCLEPADAPYTANFQINGDSLTLSFPSLAIVLKLNTAAAGSGSPTGLVLENGCFLDNGTFVKSPITPVGTCGVAGGACAPSAGTCCNSYACTNGGTCAAICTQDTQCKSGCCLGAPGTLRVCAPAASCK